MRARTVCGLFLMDGAACRCQPIEVAGFQRDIVAERVAVEESAFRILEHRGDGRNAGMQMRLEGRRGHHEVIHHQQRIHAPFEHVFGKVVAR